MSDYGIKISKAGYDVKTTDDVNLVLTSEYRMMNLHLSGSVTINLASGNKRAGTDIAHGLGFTPAFFCYGTDDTYSAGSEKYKQLNYSRNFLAVSYPTYFAWADDTNVHIEMNFSGLDAPDDYEATIKYYITSFKIN